MDDAILSVRDLKVHFPVRKGILARTVGHVKAVDGVSFELGRGETLGIVGESGSGKSTIVRAIAGLVRPTAGDIVFHASRVSPGSRPKVAMVLQDPLGSLNPRWTVGEIVGTVPRSVAKPDVAALLDEVGLDPASADKYPHEFSGGERQRVCIARALAVNPEILICDEAVSALDLSVRAQVLDLLSELRERRRLSILFITHDLGVVRHFCPRTLVMYRGRIVEEGATASVMSAPRCEYTKRLLASVLRI